MAGFQVVALRAINNVASALHFNVARSELAALAGNDIGRLKTINDALKEDFEVFC